MEEDFIPDDDDPNDPDAPTKLRRPTGADAAARSTVPDKPRVRVHPKFDPRKIPTLRRRLEAKAAPEGLAPSLSARRGVELAWVVAFLGLVALTLVVAVVARLR